MKNLHKSEICEYKFYSLFNATFLKLTRHLEAQVRLLWGLSTLKETKYFVLCKKEPFLFTFLFL